MILASIIIGAWLLLCLILLAANPAFKLSRKAEGDTAPDPHASHLGVGATDFILDHQERI
jgi:hypothetical protein